MPLVGWDMVKNMNNVSEFNNDTIRCDKCGAVKWTTKNCPLCGKGMLVKEGVYGKFLSCIDFPICRGKLNIPDQLKNQ